MAITIKEIHVKTTVTRQTGAVQWSEEAIGQLRERILRELQEEERKKAKRRHER